MTFLRDPYPYPERIVVPCQRTRLSGEFVPTQPNPMLSIGVQLIEKDRQGCRIAPHKAVVVAFGDDHDPEQSTFNMQPSQARDVARRIIEMCDAIEKDQT